MYIRSMPIIYELLNRYDGKVYVGRTVKALDARWDQHLRAALREDNVMLVCRAIRKHGPHAFVRRVIEECDEASMGDRERFWIDELGSHVSRGGYNLTLGGDGGLPGYEFSEESKEKMRAAATGRVHTPESKLKMSLAKKGRKQSPESVAKRVATNTGKKRTEEQKAKISAGNMGLKRSEETRKKISEANRNRAPISDETREKLRNRPRRVVTDSLREKCRLAGKATCKPVAQVDESENVIQTHESVTLAAASAGVSVTTMSRLIRNMKTMNGHHWVFVEKELEVWRPRRNYWLPIRRPQSHFSRS